VNNHKQYCYEAIVVVALFIYKIQTKNGGAKRNLHFIKQILFLLQPSSPYMTTPSMHDHSDSTSAVVVRYNRAGIIPITATLRQETIDATRVHRNSQNSIFLFGGLHATPPVKDILWSDP
jgi:hypothetical protein